MTLEWIFLMASFVLTGEAKTTTHFKFMSNYCSDSIKVLDSVVVVLVPPAVLRSDRTLDFIQCNLDLVAPKGHGLHAHFLHVSISPDHKHSDRLQLSEIDSKGETKSLTPDQGLYGMLDRSILTSDYDGAKINDYNTWKQRLRLDYLGKPTKVHSGFRVLITAVKKPGREGECPSEMSKCSVQPLCIPSVLMCDGYPNCGDQDLTDEKGCDAEHMVTDLMDNYSLMFDIVVITCVPALVFLLFVILVLCLTWRHMKKKYPRKEAPAVSYRAGDGEHVQVHDNSYDPPSYNEVVRLQKPPAYSSLEAMEQAGAVIIESDDDHYTHGSRGRRYNNGKHKQSFGASNSSLDSTQSFEMQRVHPTSRSARPMLPQYDSSDDEETRRRQRRKGGKGKVKGKRRADDLCPQSKVMTDPKTGEEPRLPNSQSQSEMALGACGPRVYSPTVPFVSFACPSLSVASSSSSVPMSSPSPPPLGMKSSPSTESEGANDDKNRKGNAKIDRSASSTPDIAVLPVTNGRSPNAKAASCMPEDSLQSDSSGVEADRKSETESGSWNQNKSDSKTESCSSLSENRKSPASLTGKANGGKTIKEDFARIRSCQQGGEDDGDKSNKRIGKTNLADKFEEEDRTIEDVYMEEMLNQDGYEIDLRSKEAVALKTKGSSII